MHRGPAWPPSKAAVGACGGHTLSWVLIKAECSDTPVSGWRVSAGRKADRIGG